MNTPPSILGIYQPGDTLLHRLTPGFKLLALFFASIVVMTVRGPVSGVIFLGIAIILVAWSGMRRKVLIRTLRSLVLLIAVLATFHAWRNGIERAIEVTADLVALILAATVVTATTPIDAMFDTITRALGPFRRFGVNPDRVSLAFALMIRSVPLTLEIASETHAAAKARGLERNPRAYLVPLTLRVVAQARETGSALAARGIGDD